MREERDSAAGGKLGAGTVRTNVTGNLTMMKGDRTVRQWDHETVDRNPVGQ